MDITAGMRRSFIGDRRRSGDPKASTTFADARKAYGSWRGVAQAMGVSERTLRRIRNEGRVSPASRRRIGELGRQGAVRRAAVRPGASRRAGRMIGSGASVRIDGEQGPRGFGRGSYRRNRAIEFELSPDEVEQIRNAYLDGDDERAAQLLGDAAQNNYGGGTIRGDGWDFGELDDFSIDEFTE